MIVLSSMMNKTMKQPAMYRLDYKKLGEKQSL